MTKAAKVTLESRLYCIPLIDSQHPWIDLLSMDGSSPYYYHYISHRRYFPTNSDTIHGWRIPSIDGDTVHRRQPSTEITYHHHHHHGHHY